MLHLPTASNVLQAKLHSTDEILITKKNSNLDITPGNVQRINVLFRADVTETTNLSLVRGFAAGSVAAGHIRGVPNDLHCTMKFQSQFRR